MLTFMFNSSLDFGVLFFVLLNIWLFILATKIISGKHFTPNLAQCTPPLKALQLIVCIVNNHRTVLHDVPYRLCNIIKVCTNAWKLTVRHRASFSPQAPSLWRSLLPEVRICRNPMNYTYCHLLRSLYFRFPFAPQMQTVKSTKILIFNTGF